jgi:hypothetical protein
MPRVEKKDLLGSKLQVCLSQTCREGSEPSSLAGMGCGLCRTGQAMREGESSWSQIICDHQMEQVNRPR